MAVAGSLTYDTKLDGKGFSEGLSGIGKISGTIFKGIATGIAVATTAVAGLVTASTKAYAEYEQLVGGVDTLFKNSSQQVQEYANNAYKTAGLSANQYMETVTSFSASLLQSLGGDTEKSAQYADQAIIDMSDNANKMGTSMESIQNAYQGFAKQNYTMLDNLKLGYGGTKTEMERLIADANRVKEANGEMADLSIESFADVTEAIHIIQTEMGITGTTAKEAETTITGSLNMVKASWDNLLVGMANGEANMGDLINQLVESVATFAGNLMPVVEQALLGVGTLIETLLPQIIDRIPTIVNEVLPKLMESGVQIVTSLINGIQQNLPQIVQGASMMIQTLLMGIIPLLPQILQMGIQIIVELAKGLAQMLPTLIPVMVDAIITIVETLIDNIDQVVDAGIELIIALADGLIEALPRLIEKAPVIISKLVDAIIRNFPKIVKAGGELLGKLVMGILGAISKLIEVAPRLIQTLGSGLKAGLEEIKNVGRYLLEGLWNGISDKAQWLRQQLESLGGNIVNWAKKVLKIGSPSKVFRDEVGRWIPEGIAVGIKADTDSALEALDVMNDEMVNRMNKAVNFEVGKAGTSGITGSVSEILNTNSKIVVENNNTLQLDGEKIYENQQIIQKNKNLQYGFGGVQ